MEGTNLKYVISNNVNIEKLEDGKYSIFIWNTQKNYVVGENEYKVLKAIEECRRFEEIYINNPSFSKEQINRIVQVFLKMGIIVEEGKNEKILFARAGVLKFKFKICNCNLLLKPESTMVRLMYYLLIYGALPILILGVISVREKIGLFTNASTYTQVSIYWYLLILFGATACHELGHAIVARKLNISVPEIGILIYFLYPVVYTNMSFTRLLKKRRDRMKCLLAGIFVNCMLVGLSLITVGAIDNLELIHILIVNATINFLVIATNLIVFFKLDGYYILQDFLGIQMMYEKSIEKFVSFIVKPFVFIVRRKAKRNISSLAPGTSYQSVNQNVQWEEFLLLYGAMCVCYIPLMIISVILNISFWF